MPTLKAKKIVLNGHYLDKQNLILMIILFENQTRQRLAIVHKSSMKLQLG